MLWSSRTVAILKATTRQTDGSLPDQQHHQLGPFDLIEPIGQGGMGVVWRGVHRAQGVPIAAKVIGRGKALARPFVLAFHNEVQAVARLNHPGIVMVFDYGVIPKEFENSTEGQVTAGSPYLIMEWLGGRTLRQRLRPASWKDLKATIEAILNPLAYAHARGVVHRDLTPKNMIFGAAAAHRLGLKLIDFGLASVGRLQKGFGEEKISGGTPGYLAPEQLIRPAECEQGPWTDLYSVGCTVYELAAGRRPFERTKVTELATAHLIEPVPPLNPSFDVPVGFQAWLARMMETDPKARFRRAADAIHALQIIDANSEMETHPADRLRLERTAPPDLSMPSPPIDSIRAFVDSELHDSTAPITGDTTVTHVTLGPKPPGQPKTLKKSFDVTFPFPSIPGDWRYGEAPRPPMSLVGAGLGLYGLRATPLVSRERERDRMWSTLIRVVKQGRAEAVVIRGSAGVGKSRLAQWITERAHEVGAATVLKAVHHPSDSARDGIPQMLERYTACAGLSRKEQARRFDDELSRAGINDSYLVKALTEMIAPDEGDPRNQPGDFPRVWFRSAVERYAVLAQTLGHWSTNRPLCVWFDDVHWGSDSLDYLSYHLTHTAFSNHPILFLVTVSDEALAERASESLQLESLSALDTVDTIELTPFSRSNRRHLIRGLLGLEGELAADVEERTGGNPLFAVELVGDWVRRGLLEVGSSGFTLCRGAQVALPDTVYDVWSARIDRFVDEAASTKSSGDQGAAPRENVETHLMLAATLGQEVNEHEWRAAAVDLTDDAVVGLLERLTKSRLAVPTESGFCFVHPMLRESLTRRAIETGIHNDLHRACGDILLNPYQLGKSGYAERLASHLINSESLERALDPLSKAARERWFQGDYRMAHSLLDKHDSTLDQLGRGPRDRDRVENWLIRSSIYYAQGVDLNAAGICLKKAEEAAEAEGITDLHGEALRQGARLFRVTGKPALSEEKITRALSIFEAAGNDEKTTACLKELGFLEAMTGRHDSALERLTHAQAGFETHENGRGCADCCEGLGFIAYARGDFQASFDHYQDASQWWAKLGNRAGEGDAQNAIGEILRAMGDDDGAETASRNALAIHRSIDSARGVYCEFNLCLILLDKGAVDEALTSLIEIDRICETTHRKVLLGPVRCALLECAAAKQDWRLWDKTFATVAPILESGDYVERDIAERLERAGRFAADADDFERSEKAYTFAQRFWTALGNEEGAERVSAALNKVKGELL